MQLDPRLQWHSLNLSFQQLKRCHSRRNWIHDCTCDELNLEYNSLRGPIPDAIGSSTWLCLLELAYNSLRGPIPDAIGSRTQLWELNLEYNSLRGPIPDVVASLRRLSTFSAFNNELSGSLPSGLFVSLEGLTWRDFKRVCVSQNLLTGTLPTLENLDMMMVSDNLLEGTLPNTISSRLRIA